MPLDIDCESQGVFNGKQAWEFINPVASVPPGWLHLQNVSSGHVLSQTYSSLPPIARSTTLNSSAFPESWATQWALIRSSEWGYNTIRSRSYVIINRLAGGCLGSQASKFAHRGEEPGSVNAWEMSPSEKELWRLELDRQSNWKIVHQQSGFLLEEAVVPLLNGNEIVCVTKTPDKRRSWMFV
jgi:hypothetical protein